MTYNRCGQSGLKLPAIALGLWHNFGDVDDFENARDMIRTAFDHGITHFDLANNYGPPPGSAEENFGRILKSELAAYRDEMVITSKAGYLMWPGPYGEWGSRKYLTASLDQSLKRMGLEYVDIFYSHRPDPEIQARAEELLGERAGAVVAMDPSSKADARGRFRVYNEDFFLQGLISFCMHTAVFGQRVLNSLVLRMTVGALLRSISA